MRRVSLLALAFTLAACGRDSTGPTPSTARIPGTYNLTMVDGQVLPFLALDVGAYQVRVVSGALTLRSDGSYSYTIGHRTDDSGNIRTGTDTDVGLWNITGDSIRLASTQTVFSHSGVVSGDAITLQSTTRVLVLKKNR